MQLHNSGLALSVKARDFPVANDRRDANMALRTAIKRTFENRSAVRRGFSSAAIKEGFSSAFQNHKYKMNTAVGFGVSVLGDTLAQQSESLMLPVEQRQNQDWKRSLSVGAFGACVYGGVITQWYVMLERILGPCTGVGKVLAAKILADELILGPAFNGSYLAFHAAYSGEDIKQSLSNNFVPTMMADFVIWPPAMYFGFLKMSAAVRPAYVATVGVMWNGILSYMGRREVGEITIVQEHDDESRDVLAVLGGVVLASPLVTASQCEVGTDTPTIKL